SVQWTVPYRTVFTTVSKPFGVSFSESARKLPAALLTRPSTCPKRSAAWETSASHCAGSRTSAADVSAAPPARAAAAVSGAAASWGGGGGGRVLRPPGVGPFGAGGGDRLRHREAEPRAAAGDDDRASGEEPRVEPRRAHCAFRYVSNQSTVRLTMSSWFWG